MAGKLNVGDKMPSFSLKDHEGLDVNSEDLLGEPFVLYFYPKDDTPGCTKEACSFRDNMEHLDEFDALVIGVSPDGAASHAKFIEKYDLNFPLLCDEKLELARKFGVVQEKEQNGKKSTGVVRSTFIIDASGIIRWMEKPVSVEGHAERVLQAFRQEI